MKTNCDLCKLKSVAAAGDDLLLNANYPKAADLANPATMTLCPHHQYYASMPYNAFTNYFPASAPSLMDMVLAAHWLRGYYQPAGPLITHTNAGGGTTAGNQQPPSSQASLKPSKAELSSSSSHQVHQPLATPPGGLDQHPMDVGGDLHRSQPFRYIPQPYPRPIHQLHCTYPPPPPPPPTYYPAYGQHPQEICYSPTYQPYFPQKVYASAPQYRRFVGGGSYYQGGSPADLYDHQSSSRLLPPPPPPGAPTLDQYSNPYYSPYAGPASPCYSRGMQPYLDSPPPPQGPPPGGPATGQMPNPYQTSCPCPMQSCPKNVLTGPLIGSQVMINKGPGQASSASSNGSGCKTEQDQRMAEENMYRMYPHHHHSSHKEQHYEKVAAAPPNYTVNTTMEPEMSTSPARGSTGLPVPSTPISPPQMESNLLNPNTTVRKARIGKNMVRERQLMMTSGHNPADPINIYNAEMANHHHHHHYHDLMYGGQPPAPIYHHMKYPDRGYSQGPYHPVHAYHHTKAPEPPPEFLKTVKQELPEIKAEHIVKEEVISSDDSDSSKAGDGTQTPDEKIEERTENKCDNVEKQKESSVTKPNEENNEDEDKILIDERSQSSEAAEVITGETEEDVAPAKGRMALSFTKNIGGPLDKPKKSNYKKLIKPAEPKPYLCPGAASQGAGDKCRRRIISRHKAGGKFVRRRLVSSTTSRHSRSMHFSVRRTKIYLYKKRRSKLRKSKSALSVDQESVKEKLMEVQSSIPPEDQDVINNNDNKELNNNHISIADQSSEKKSNLETTIDLVARGHFAETMGQSKKDDQLISVKRSKLKRGKPKCTKPCENTPNHKEVKVVSRKATKSKPGPRPKSKDKSKKARVEEAKKEDDDDDKQEKEIVLETLAERIVKEPEATLLPETVVEGEKKEEVGKKEDEEVVEDVRMEEVVEEEEELSKTAFMPQQIVRPGRRPKSRAPKYSTKKKYRQRQVKMEMPILRKNHAVPRWSNGWSWLGPSFQGHVFLNSDDTPMLRTCYPAMRHSEGDIVRPRDCVLLRAGSKRNELPYVAKVAHLWENPEDGEMMMSLLWYYRPEHTEQGRQDIDGIDEVFASRHKDHNSVACIEDKCYVLTFNEYCRYRRLLKSIEEHVDLPPSIVPPLKSDQDGLIHPKVPPNTSPELVMFCHRVYEFRLKRMKNSY